MLAYDILIPTFIALLIVSMAMASSPALLGLKYSLLEAILVVGIPMLLGLIWNKWAGGATGFLLGSLYSLYYADQLYATQGHTDIALVGNLASAMLIGYMAGALNKRSEDFRRMLISGVVATTIGGIFLFAIMQLSPSNLITGVDGFLITVATRTAMGVIIPIIAKVFMWYGFAMHK
ncbi:MAG: hypothetical protein NWF09_00715 [Candidatus Bathyarchaeota archaeon]|nr:hypothetical protein [Candidatus Bathyarchaeota archaeon]